MHLEITVTKDTGDVYHNSIKTHIKEIEENFREKYSCSWIERACIVKVNKKVCIKNIEKQEMQINESEWNSP